MIFDTHAHYDDDQFDLDRDYLLDKGLKEKGVARVTNIGCDLPTSRMTDELQRNMIIYTGQSE